MDAPPAAAMAVAVDAFEPRVIAASSLSQRVRDSLIAAGPDTDMLGLLAASGSAFSIADPSAPDMPLAYVSPGFEAMTGYSASEAIGRNCRFLQGPGTDAAARARMATALREGRGCTEVLLNYRRDGAPFWNRVVLAPLRDSTGAVRSFVSVQSCVSKPLSALASLGGSAQARAHADRPAPAPAAWIPGAAPGMPPPQAPPASPARNSRAAAHGAALSDADAAMLIRSIAAQQGASPADRPKRGREAADDAGEDGAGRDPKRSHEAEQ